MHTAVVVVSVKMTNIIHNRGKCGISMVASISMSSYLFSIYRACRTCCDKLLYSKHPDIIKMLQDAMAGVIPAGCGAVPVTACEQYQANAAKMLIEAGNTRTFSCTATAG
jgi:hypothetical protein